jgi:DNA-3-methyladenine glycosylase I
LYQAYHDTEWGVPVHEERRHFEFLLLEGAQAGLSWSTILRKREGYRKAFDGFDPERVARYGGRRIEALLGNPAIVRNRSKIESAVSNARCFLAVEEERGSFDSYIWSFVDHRPIVNHWRRLSQIPTSTPLAERLSRDLVRRGFRFVGPTIIYAHMQAIGMVNDHLVSCFRHAELAQLASSPTTRRSRSMK